MIRSKNALILLALLTSLGGCATSVNEDPATTTSPSEHDGDEADVTPPLADQSQPLRRWQGSTKPSTSIFDEEGSYDPQIPHGPFPQPWTPDPEQK